MVPVPRSALALFGLALLLCAPAKAATAPVALEASTGVEGVDVAVEAGDTRLAARAHAPDVGAGLGSEAVLAQAQESAAIRSRGFMEGPGTAQAAAVALAATPPAALALWGALRWAAAAGGLGMYSRISRGAVLDHPLRKRIYEHVRAVPGVSPTELQTLLQAGWGTVVHHLDRLQRNGYVRSERVGLSRRYFAVGEVAPGEKEALGLLRKPALERLAAEVLTLPGRPQGELAEALGLNRSAASKQLAQLEDAGLVRREREGRTATVWPTDALSRALPPAGCPVGAGAPGGAATA